MFLQIISVVLYGTCRHLIHCLGHLVGVKWDLLVQSWDCLLLCSPSTSCLTWLYLLDTADRSYDNIPIHPWGWEFPGCCGGVGWPSHEGSTLLVSRTAVLVCHCYHQCVPVPVAWHPCQHCLIFCQSHACKVISHPYLHFYWRSLYIGYADFSFCE